MPPPRGSGWHHDPPVPSGRHPGPLPTGKVGFPSTSGPRQVGSPSHRLAAQESHTETNRPMSGMSDGEAGSAAERVAGPGPISGRDTPLTCGYVGTPDRITGPQVLHFAQKRARRSGRAATLRRHSGAASQPPPQ